MIIMGKKARATAAEINATDALAKPLVAIPTPETLAAVRGLLGPDNATDMARASSETTGSSTETTVEKNSEEEDGGSKETTTTTTTETNYSSAEPDDADDSDDGDDSDDDEPSDKKGPKEAAAMIAAAELRASSPAPTRMVTGDVLKAVRELTGAATPTDQIAKLSSLVGERDAARAELRTIKRAASVDEAIRAGRLTPAERSFALTLSPKQLAAKLSTSSPVVRRTPLAAVKDPKAAARAAGNAPGTPSAEAIAVARAMGMDPKTLEAHRSELVTSGVLH